MEELFKFDLQLFAEDDGDTGTDPTDETEGQGEGEENDDSDTGVLPPSNTDEDDSDYDTGLDATRIALDENGNVVFLDDEEEDKPPKTPEESEDEGPAKRKIKVGDEEVEVTEDELIKGYLRQSDYTKKAQELARQREEIERLAKQAMKPPVEVAPPAPQEDFATFNKRITEEAKALARQRLNLEPDAELSEVDFEHQNAFRLAQKEIESYLEQTTRHHRDITVMEREMRSEEPEFDKVFEFMMDRLENELPNKVSKEVEKAYAEADTAYLKKFFNDMRVDYYAKKNGTETKLTPKVAKVPPKVETAGKGDMQTQKQKRDASILRNPEMTFEDKVRKLKEWNLV